MLCCCESDFYVSLGLLWAALSSSGTCSTMWLLHQGRAKMLPSKYPFCSSSDAKASGGQDGDALCNG